MITHTEHRINIFGSHNLETPEFCAFVSVTGSYGFGPNEFDSITLHKRNVDWFESFLVSIPQKPVGWIPKSDLDNQKEEIEALEELLANKKAELGRK